MIYALALSLLASDFEVSGATVSAYPIAVAEVATAGKLGLASAQLRKRIEPMLDLTGMFRVLDRASFLAPATEPAEAAQINWEAWQQVERAGCEARPARQRAADGGQLAPLRRRHTSPLDQSSIKTDAKKAASAAPAIADAVILRLSGERVLRQPDRLYTPGGA